MIRLFKIRLAKVEDLDPVEPLALYNIVDFVTATDPQDALAVERAARPEAFHYAMRVEREIEVEPGLDCYRWFFLTDGQAQIVVVSQGRDAREAALAMERENLGHPYLGPRCVARDYLPGGVIALDRRATWA